MEENMQVKVKVEPRADEAATVYAAPQTEAIVITAAAIGEVEPTGRILIAPWGEVRTAAGAFVVDEEAAAATIAAFAAHGTDLPVDYEHQTLGGAYSSPTGQAPAAGWIKALSIVTPEEARAGGAGSEAGLWAEVQWTPEAAQRLRGRQYRYLSPVALVRRSDRRIVGLHSVALTNKPAIVGMRPMVSSALVAPLRRPDAADLRAMLALDESASDELVLVAAARRIGALEMEQASRAAEERVASALAAGKLSPAQRTWALSLARRDPAEFERWEESAPVLVAPGRLAAPKETIASSLTARSIESAARIEYQANRALLEKLCTEEAYVACAMREQGA
jgi:phage I-like protein